MKYLLSNLEITDSVIDYILDLIKVYFVVESSQIPQINIGVHKRIDNSNKNVILDTISLDVSNFVGLLSSQGILVSVNSIDLVDGSVEIKLSYNDEIINFTLE